MKRFRLVSVVKLMTFFCAVRTCFDHVLYKFSGFSSERILFLNSACANMVMQIQVQIGDTRRVFLWLRLGVWRILKKNYILCEIPKTRFMDFGLLYENGKGEYLVLNDVRMAYICLASLVYLLVYISRYCVPVTLLRQNKPFRLLYLGHAQIINLQRYWPREWIHPIVWVWQVLRHNCLLWGNLRSLIHLKNKQSSLPPL